MELKPGYKQTKVGVIPEEWDVRELHSLTRSHNSGVYKRQALYGHGCNIVGVSDIYDIEKVDGQHFAYVPLSAQERAKHTLDCNDLLYGESSLVREGIARTVYVTDRGAGTAFAWHTRRYSVEQRMLLSSYLYYYLQSRPARAHMLSQSIQTAITGINTVAYFACPITVPPPAEQEAIAEALSDADALIESLEQLLAKKRHIKQGAMRGLLTGKKRVPGFSGQWEVKRLGDVADTDPENLGTDTPPSFVFNYIALEDVAVGKLSSYSEQVFRTAPSRARRKLRGGDVLVSTVRPNLMSHMLFSGKGHDWVCSTGFCVVRCKQGITDPRYIYFHMFAAGVTRQIEALVTGSNYPAINSGDVRALKIPFPAFEEQTAIASILADIDAEIAALEAKLVKARSLKQGMMHELLTGAIRLPLDAYAEKG